VIAARSAMLVATAGMVVGGFRVTTAELTPSATRLVGTAIVALVAPLLWPGAGTNRAQTARRVVVWSIAAAAAAAIALRTAGGGHQTWVGIGTSCLMLTLILLVAHAAAAALETHWRARSVDADNAREVAGRTAAFALALLGALPIWLGPAAELLERPFPWSLDAVIAASPLTHLAVASDNDLLRNPWLYQHSNLATLPVFYPGIATLVGAYLSICGLLALVAAFPRRPRVAMVRPAGADPSPENNS
jgi:hypothetical protein